MHWIEEKVSLSYRATCIGSCPLASDVLDTRQLFAGSPQREGLRAVAGKCVIHILALVVLGKHERNKPILLGRGIIPNQNMRIVAIGSVEKGLRPVWIPHAFLLFGIPHKMNC